VAKGADIATPEKEKDTLRIKAPLDLIKAPQKIQI